MRINDRALFAVSIVLPIAAGIALGFLIKSAAGALIGSIFGFVVGAFLYSTASGASDSTPGARAAAARFLKGFWPAILLVALLIAALLLWVGSR
jgi:hypothetical protein